MRKILAIILLTISPSLWANCTYLAYTGLAADVVTTVGAIESGRGVEANPIYPKGDWFYPTLAAVTFIRAYTISFVDDYSVRVIIRETDTGKIESVSYEDRYDWVNCVVASMSLAAAGNNAAIWAGRPDDRLTYAGVGLMIPIISFTFGGR